MENVTEKKSEDGPTENLHDSQLHTYIDDEAHTHQKTEDPVQNVEIIPETIADSADISNKRSTMEYLNTFFAILFPSYWQIPLLILEIIITLSIFISYFFIFPSSQWHTLLYMPFPGFICSILTVSTPMSGTFFFAIASWLLYDALYARMFSIACLLVTHGFSGVITWFSRDMNDVLWFPIVIGSFFGICGVFISDFAYPITDPIAIRVVVGILQIISLICLVSLNGNKNEKLKVNAISSFSLVLGTLVAGWTFGYTGVGMDAGMFLILSFLRISNRSAMVTAIAVDGIVCLSALVFQIRSVPLNMSLWVATLIGVFLGARVAGMIPKEVSMYMYIPVSFLTIFDLLKTFIELAFYLAGYQWMKP